VDELVVVLLVEVEELKLVLVEVVVAPGQSCIELNVQKAELSFWLLNSVFSQSAVLGVSNTLTSSIKPVKNLDVVCAAPILVAVVGVLGVVPFVPP